MFACKLDGPRVDVTKPSQDAAVAKRAAASRTNLPNRSLRTVGRMVGLSRRRFFGCVVVKLWVGGSSGGLGFGGLGGSSVGDWRWPPHHKALSSQVWKVAFSVAVSAR